MGAVTIIYQIFMVGRTIGSSLFLFKQWSNDLGAVEKALLLFKQGGDDFFVAKKRSKQSLKRTKSIPETSKHIKELITSNNATYVRFLLDRIKNRSYDGGTIVVERYRLVLFTQGKVASTVFKQLARRMMELEDWMVDNRQVPHNPATNGLSYLKYYKTADALTILTSSRWTRAIFVRDPKERILSAFLDKAARNGGEYITNNCCQTFSLPSNSNRSYMCGDHAHGSFLGFLEVVQSECCCDGHWMPQSSRIDWPFRPYITFVGHFDRIQEDTKQLLHLLSIRSGEADLWARFGASGWGSNSSAIFSESTKANHKTSARANLSKYYNSTVDALVEELYYEDYTDRLLNFTSLTS
ncbi:hypothetical protein ACHAXA_001465 [Cyclostephanos tholiformis]|uniref:Sulfotransferase n=1 Tax=Cyclostephanos tholiformis TaxID=382380 RepID=A0ABD3RZ15_9STRA